MSETAWKGKYLTRGQGQVKVIGSLWIQGQVWGQTKYIVCQRLCGRVGILLGFEVKSRSLGRFGFKDRFGVKHPKILCQRLWNGRYLIRGQGKVIGLFWGQGQLWVG